MAHSFELPDDLFGLTIEEIKRAIQGTKARVTNKDFSFDLLKKFQVTAVGRLKIAAPSKKRLDAARFWIKEAARKKVVAQSEKNN